VLLPQRDAAIAAAATVAAAKGASTPVADAIQATLPAGQFTSGTYRRKQATRRR
jgi:hypothetical protein